MGDATATRPARAGLLDAVMYAVATLVPLAVIVLLIRPWETGLAVPFAAGGDAAATGAVVKGVLRTGWWLTNPALGAPGISNAFDLPGADTLLYVLIRLIGFGSGDWATVINVFYLLGYSVVGLTAVFALRKLGASRPVAACGAIVYALLPYHWMRGEGHLFLSFYAMVPLLVLVAFWMDGRGVPLLGPQEGSAPPKWDLRSKRSIAALAICVVGAATGLYYAFFGAALIVFAGVRAAVRSRERRIALAGLTLAVTMGLVAIVQAAPNLVLAAPLGRNPAGLVRNPGQAEVAGLKITQMFLPIDGHRVAAFARLKAVYRAGLRQISPTLDNEANMAALGILVALGFLVSLLAFAFAPSRGSPEGGPDGMEMVRSAGFLNLCALLLATVGGFGAMVAVVLPQIRDYNRISIFIGFISIVALAVLADRFLAKRTGRWARAGWIAALVAVTALAVLDQTPASLAVPMAQADQYRSDVALGAVLTSTLPAGTVVFQLPYMPYPEPGGPTFGMQDYDPMRGYLHVDGFRWSYGAMKGRADDAWQKATAALPPAEMVAAARARGFTAIWVQLNGYQDGGVAVRTALTGLLGEPAAVSGDGVFAVWKL
jgi:phosphoglycerol transferase